MRLFVSQEVEVELKVKRKRRPMKDEEREEAKDTAFLAPLYSRGYQQGRVHSLRKAATRKKKTLKRSLSSYCFPASH